MMDGRLALARLCALQARYDEAVDWFALARVVLDEQEARPLRAIVDYDEALMFARRNARGDRARAVPLLEAALAQFAAIDMPGWIRRARSLLVDHREWVQDTKAAAAADKMSGGSRHAAATRRATVSGAVKLGREGSYWTLVSSEGTRHLKDIKGLHYLVMLLRDPGREFHVLDLVQTTSRQHLDGRERARGPGDSGLEILDATAKAAYKERLAELHEELAEAEAFNDRGRAERARMEIDAIGDELSVAVGLGGRDRTRGSAAERARSTVTKRIKDAIKAMTEMSPALGTHLEGRVRTGVFCVYLPDATSTIEWEL
jgi:hypothetical protein